MVDLTEIANVLNDYPSVLLICSDSPFFMQIYVKKR